MKNSMARDSTTYKKQIKFLKNTNCQRGNDYE